MKHISQQPRSHQITELAKTVAGFVENDGGREAAAVRRCGADSLEAAIDWYAGVMISTQGLSESIRPEVNKQVATSLVITIIEENTRSLSEDDPIAISRDYLATLSGLSHAVATKIAEQLVGQGAIERHRLPNGGNRAYYTRKPKGI